MALQINPDFVPSTLIEAIIELRRAVPKSDLGYMNTCAEDEMWMFQKGFSSVLVDNWSLKESSFLADWFHRINIFHPEDMVGILLTTLWRDLHGVEWDVESQAAKIHDYWVKKVGRPNPLF